MERFFKLKENNTTIRREVIGGLTTFMSMAYIFFMNPQILGQAGMPSQGVFLAAILVAGLGTMFMGLFANVPFALAPGIGLQAYFVYTIVFGFKFSWQQALAIVFLVGLVDLIITLSNGRKAIVKAIPEELKAAIAGGIGLFIGYIGLKNSGFINFIVDKVNVVSGWGTESMVANGGVTPELANFNQNGVILALISLIMLIILIIKKVPAAFLISLIITTIIGIPLGVTNIRINAVESFNQTFNQFGQVFGAGFSGKGIPSLFNNLSSTILTIATVFAVGLTGLFDAIGTLLGTGSQTNIFSKKDFSDEKGIKTKLDKSLVADTITTTAAGILGTSNTTVFIESATGVAAGARTGLANIVTAIGFFLMIVLAPLVGVVPTQATAPILIVVGIMMMGELGKIDWTDIEVAIPSFFTSAFMAFTYSISYGIAAGFIFYILIKLITGKFKDLNPVILIVGTLFIINFVMIALRIS